MFSKAAPEIPAAQSRILSQILDILYEIGPICPYKSIQHSRTWVLKSHLLTHLQNRWWLFGQKDRMILY